MITGDKDDDAMAHDRRIVAVDRLNKPAPDTALADRPAWRAADFLKWRRCQQEESGQ